MKLKFALFFAFSATTLHSFGTVGIQWEFSALRNSLEAPLTVDTAYILVADSAGNGVIPGASDVTGLSLTAGALVGQGKIFFAGLTTLETASNGILSLDMASFGVTSGDKWSILWFPGITSLSSPVLAGQSFGSFQSSVIDPGLAGFATQPMTFPSDGSDVTTAYYDNTSTVVTTTFPTVAQFSATQTAAVLPLSWDTNNATTGAQGGAGTWDTSTSNWHVGSINTTWLANGTNNDAIFAGTAGIVNLPSALSANDLTFNTTGYSLTGGPLTLNGTTPTVTTNTGVTTEIATQIQGSDGLIKAGLGTLNLIGTNIYTGTTTLTSGTLVVTGSTSATSPILVQTGATLAGTGTLGGNVTVQSGGTYSPGNPGAAGTQTATGDLTLQAGSIFSWNLTTPSTSTGFDRVTGSPGKIFSAAGTFQVVTNLDFAASPFWDTNQTWNTIATGFGTNTGWSGTSSALVYDSLGTLRNDVDLHGTFSISGPNLTWTAVPEVSNCLIGGLLGLGVLRRRRAETCRS
jgi:autotransporter-associated beta strand protein